MKRNWKRPLLAGFIGLVFTFVLAESTIRIVGSMHFGEHKPIEQGSASEFRIVCLGNSHTFGFGVPKGSAYPDVLNDFLRSERPDFPIKVVNHGMGNFNTTNVLNEFRENIHKELPDLVFMMVGQPNFWNKEGFQDFLIETEGYNPHATSSFVQFLSRSKIIRWLLVLPYEKRQVEPSAEMKLEEEAFEILGKHFFIISSQNVHVDEGKRMNEVLTSILAKNEKKPLPATREILITLARLEWIHHKNYNKAIDYLEQSFRLYPIRQNPLTTVSIFNFLHQAKDPAVIKRLESLRAQIKNEFTQEELKKYFDLFVRNDKKLHEDPALVSFQDEARKLVPAATYLHVNLADYYKSQGKLDKAVEVASELVMANPLQSQSSRVYNYFSPESISTYSGETKKKAQETRDYFIRRFPSRSYLLEGSGDEKIEQWVIRDIGLISKTAKDAKAEVIVQGYHWLRELHNRVQLETLVSRAANEHHLRYLEQHDLFRNELSNNEDSFYVDVPGLPPKDTHPSEKGHRLIARIMYDYLNREKLLPEELLNLDAKKIYRYKTE